MSVELYEVHAFTHLGQGGNPAGVVLDAELNALTAEDMQRIASMAGYSETAFVLPSEVADVRLRFFTPTDEVDLCGHATISAFWLLQAQGLLQDRKVLKQETLAGVLEIRIEAGRVLMEQAEPVFGAILEPDEIMWSLGLTEEDLALGLPVQIVSTGLKDILVPVASVEVLESLTPDFEDIRRISRAFGVVGYHVFALTPQGLAEKKSDDAVTAWCRNFAPLYGIDEESATGTSNGALAAYLSAYGAAASETFIFGQGLWMGHESRINAQIECSPENGEVLKVWVGGEAILVNTVTCNGMQIDGGDDPC